MDATDSYPKPVSDPALGGLPETADDDSYADEERDGTRTADGPSPVPLPPDRDDGPSALEEYGTTAEERRRGESLDGRLAREQPEVSPDGVLIDPDPRLADDVDPELADRLGEDTLALTGTMPIDPHLDSPVSVYDRHVPGVPMAGPVGRLIQPDQGGYVDTEPDEIAYDAGFSGGGFSGEEAAMNEVSPHALNAQAGDGEPYVDIDVDAIVVRTGAEQPWDPEDLAVAEGRDPTPANVERARRELEKLGAAAIEKTVP